MTVAHFQSFADALGWDVAFGEPIRQRVAYTLDEVMPLLIGTLYRKLRDYGIGPELIAG
ncbi:MAG TPA: hypothetical protein VM166_08660 [Gemmatimonadaceae bacterium]|nr:hypothetical protein [Gemmatimonadaceae bacterium]